MEKIQQLGLEQSMKAIEFAKGGCPTCKAKLDKVKTEGSLIVDYEADKWWENPIGVQTKVTYECPNCGKNTLMIY